LAWFGLAWFGLAWLGLAWLDLVWLKIGSASFALLCSALLYFDLLELIWFCLLCFLAFFRFELNSTA
jgi:hypothetical protein